VIGSVATLVALAVMFVVLISTSDAGEGCVFSAAEEIDLSAHRTHVHLLINRFRLSRLGKLIPGRLAVAVPAATPQRSASKNDFFLSSRTERAAQCVAGADRAERAMRGRERSKAPSGPTPMAPRAPAKGSPIRGPIRGCVRPLRAPGAVMMARLIAAPPPAGWA